jgi:dTDP-4-amino-4,6-dideoxygalactose transaminase
MDGSKLAMFGGTPLVGPERGLERGRLEWPVITAADQEAVLRCLASGKLVSNAEGEPEVKGLEEEWARFVGSAHCVGVSTGTSALAIVLAALGVRPGDEVLVPALSFIATALVPLHQLAIPVFVDIDPVTFDIDATRIEEKITPRTTAILVVHLHGLPADMDEIRRIAGAHGLVVVEDACQAHGATYKEMLTGTLGDAAGFSLQVTKNLPTCGEGGLITTDDPAVYEKATLLRQFGEVIREGEERTYISHQLGWNHKLNPVQAAFARSQLARFPEYQRKRDENVTRFLGRLRGLPGLGYPVVPPDRTHAWHILRFRFDPVAAGLDGVHPGAFRKALRRALRAEGVPVSQYQLVPLPGQRVFQTREGFGRGHPWTLSEANPQSYRIEDYPETMAVVEDSLTIQRRHLNPEAGPILDLYAEAFHKVWEHLDAIARIARATAYEPPWQRTLESVRG